MSTSTSLLARIPVVQSDAGLSRYLSDIRKFPLLEATEEAALARRWRNEGDPEAAYRLVTSHLRLAAKIALRYRRSGLPVGDLISEANLGLMVAVKKFDPEKGFRLATYAVWWIKATVKEYILRSWSLVKVGTTPAQKKLFFNLGKLKARIGAYDGSLSPGQATTIAKQLAVTSEDVLEMNDRLRGDISLNIPVAQDGSPKEMIDLIVDHRADPEIMVSEAEESERRRAALKRALSVLSDRERRIVTSRFLAEDRKTLEEISAEFCVSRERVRQLEARALEKLRAAARLELAPLAKQANNSPSRRVSRWQAVPSSEADSNPTCFPPSKQSQDQRAARPSSRCF